jgi:hypothetical protein
MSIASTPRRIRAAFIRFFLFKAVSVKGHEAKQVRENCPVVFRQKPAAIQKNEAGQAWAEPRKSAKKRSIQRRDVAQDRSRKAPFVGNIAGTGRYYATEWSNSWLFPKRNRNDQQDTSWHNGRQEMGGFSRPVSRRGLRRP